jgi:hypothetical protein
MFATTLLGITISTIWALTLIALWIAIAFWPARVASRKDHSFIGYFILSLFFFPLALIMAYVVKDRSHGQAPHATTPA